MGAVTPVQIGEVYDSKFGPFTVVELVKTKPKRKFKIRFHNTGGTSEAIAEAIRIGNVKDYFVPSVAGVGYLGNARRKGNEQLHDIWRAMISRCYSTSYRSYKDYGALGVHVDERWHSFENFLQDVVKLEGWDEELFNNREIFLDKDKYSGDEKYYSLETCSWISRQENNELSSMQRSEKTMQPFIAISPEGERLEGLNANQFAREHGLAPQRVHDCLNGVMKQTKGWTFTRKE